MTAPTPALARRAVACRGWRWLPGMRYRLSPRHPWRHYDPVTESPPSARSALAVPDLSDPATLGCMLARVREAWGAPYAQASPRLTGNPTRATGWVAYLNDDEADRRFYASSEAEALVAALEAAPAAGGAR